jgi:hypothetical protein
MRKFNQREKEIIKNISSITFSEIEDFSYFLRTKYFIEENNKALLLLPKINTALLFIKKEIFDNVNNSKKEFGEFLELISLIIYLKENRYITIYPNKEILSSELLVMKESFNSIRALPNQLLQLNDNGDYIDKNNPSLVYDRNHDIIYEAMKIESDIYDLIKNNFVGLLYVSEELIQFSNNNFITEDELRFTKQLLEDKIKFRKQRMDTWISIALSFLVGLAAIIYQIYTEKNNEKNSQKSIDIQNEYLKKIAISLDSLNMKTKLITTKKEIYNKEKK